MTTLAHISYPLLAYMSLNHISGNSISNQEILILATGATLPDLDFAYQLLRGRGFDGTYNHHNWISHWPITYLPLIILSVLTHNHLLSLFTLGIFSHLFLDLFMIVDGIMVFYPFSKKFYGFFPVDTKGKHGMIWAQKYKERFIYKVDIAAASLLIVIIAIRIF